MPSAIGLENATFNRSAKATPALAKAIRKRPGNRPRDARFFPALSNRISSTEKLIPVLLALPPHDDLSLLNSWLRKISQERLRTVSQLFTVGILA